MHVVILGEKGGIRKPGGPPHANLFLSMRKNLLHFFWLYMLHCPLETCLILSSVVEIQEVERPFHFSRSIFSLSCQFYILKILVTIACFIRKKVMGQVHWSHCRRFWGKFRKIVFPVRRGWFFEVYLWMSVVLHGRVVQNVIGWL